MYPNLKNIPKACMSHVFIRCSGFSYKKIFFPERKNIFELLGKTFFLMQQFKNVCFRAHGTISETLTKKGGYSFQKKSSDLKHSFCDFLKSRDIRSKNPSWISHSKVRSYYKLKFEIRFF